MQTHLDPGYMTIDNARLNAACEAYFLWKDLNTYVKSVNTRGVNMPDVISEPIACWCLGYRWNRGTQIGDATAPDGSKVEFKATSRWEGDLSSFGPTCSFDDLVFLRFNLQRNKLYIYDLGINSYQLQQTPVNNNETFGDQQRQGRRPRLCLLDKFVVERNMEPTVVFDIRTMQIDVDNR